MFLLFTKKVPKANIENENHSSPRNIQVPMLKSDPIMHNLLEIFATSVRVVNNNKEVKYEYLTLMVALYVLMFTQKSFKS